MLIDPVAPAPMAYSSKVMVGNWWEDRHLPQGQKLSTTDRVFAATTSSSKSPDAYTTTKVATDAAMLQHKQKDARAAQVNRKPSLYSSQHVVEERLKAYMPGGRPPAELTYTLGRNLVEEAAKPPERHLDTTNKHFFQDLPQQARQADATLTQPMDRSFHRVNIHLREAAAHKHVSEGPEFGGSKGSRGEVTRHPREAGNPYGVQVFVDEYAQWGTKLAGTTLGETVSKKMTSYF